VSEFPQVQQLLRSADFALMPSRSETGPLVLIEYAMAGLPLVAYQVGNISQRMANAGIEGLVEPDDEQAFQDELLKLLVSSPQEWQKRGEHGKHIATELFDIRKVIPQWLAVYQKALK
jgi:glycosyltransferase involved in cell wall biosynthesis